MVDITEKPTVFRKAIASGSIRLKESTITADKNRASEEGRRTDYGQAGSRSWRSKIRLV